MHNFKQVFSLKLAKLTDTSITVKLIEELSLDFMNLDKHFEKGNLYCLLCNINSINYPSFSLSYNLNILKILILKDVSNFRIFYFNEKTNIDKKLIIKTIQEYFNNINYNDSCTL